MRKITMTSDLAMTSTLTLTVLMCVVHLTHSAPSDEQFKKIHKHIPKLVSDYKHVQEDIASLEETMVHFREYVKLMEEENTAPSDEEIAKDNGAEGSAKEPEPQKPRPLSPFERMRQMAAKWKKEGRSSHLTVVKPPPKKEEKKPEEEKVIAEIPEGGNSTDGTSFVAEIIEKIPEPESKPTEPKESSEPESEPSHLDSSVMKTTLMKAIARLKARLLAAQKGP